MRATTTGLITFLIVLILVWRRLPIADVLREAEANEALAARTQSNALILDVRDDQAFVEFPAFYDEEEEEEIDQNSEIEDEQRKRLTDWVALAQLWPCPGSTGDTPGGSALWLASAHAPSSIVSTVLKGAASKQRVAAARTLTRGGTWVLDARPVHMGRFGEGEHMRHQRPMVSR